MSTDLQVKTVGEVSECPFGLLRADAPGMDRHESLQTPAFVNPTKIQNIFSSEQDASEREQRDVEPTPDQKSSLNRSVLGLTNLVDQRKGAETPDEGEHANSSSADRLNRFLPARADEPQRRQSKRIAAQRASKEASAERGPSSLIGSQLSKRRRLDESLSNVHRFMDVGPAVPTPERQHPQSSGKFSSTLLQQYECTPVDAKAPCVSPPNSSARVSVATNKRTAKLSAKQAEILQRTLEKETGEVLNQI